MHIIHSYHPGFSGGIGDFLRGSVYLYNKCKENNIKLSLSWKYHPISRFLCSSCPIRYSLDYILDIQDIAIKHSSDMFFHERLQQINEYIIQTIKQENNKDPVIMSSFYLDIYDGNPLENIVKYPLSEEAKKFFQKNIIISDKIRLLKNKIIPDNQDYATMHFRLGDMHTLPNIQEQLTNIPENIKSNYNLHNFNVDYDYLYYLIQKNIRNNNFKYIVLLSDSNDFKKHVALQNNNKILITHYDSCHSSIRPGLLKESGYKNTTKESQYEATVLDLYMLINSSKNISYSNYAWGSGFSIWPSKIFDIPLEAHYLTNE